MSTSHEPAGDDRHPTAAPSGQLGALRQFAQGGHAGYHMAESNPAPTNAPLDIDTQNPPKTDRLVMLQLASFEGRAL